MVACPNILITHSRWSPLTGKVLKSLLLCTSIDKVGMTWIARPMTELICCNRLTESWFWRQLLSGTYSTPLEE